VGFTVDRAAGVSTPAAFLSGKPLDTKIRRE